MYIISGRLDYIGLDILYNAEYKISGCVGNLQQEPSTHAVHTLSKLAACLVANQFYPCVTL